MEWQEQARIEYQKAQAEKQARVAQERLEQQKRMTESVKRLDAERQKRQQAIPHPVQTIKVQGNPIEDDFFMVFCALYPDVQLERQYKIGRYRVDFAHKETKTAIEIDGYEYHHKKKDRNKDYERQHEIEDLGWQFVRFTGSQVFGDPERCARRVYNRIVAR